MKRATIVAVAVSVLCPHCGEPQPAPDNGSDMWEPYQVRAVSGAGVECVACDALFKVYSVTKVMMP